MFRFFSWPLRYFFQHSVISMLYLYVVLYLVSSLVM